MAHILCRFVKTGLTVSLAGGLALATVSTLEAQGSTPKPTPGVKMPPPISMNVAGIAGQVVGVLPATLVVARDSLAGYPPFEDRKSSTHWVDSMLGEGMMLRAPEVNWKLPAQMRALAHRAPGIAADPDYLGQAVLRDPQITNVPDPMISNLRTLMAIAGGRFVFVPAAVSFQHDSVGAVEARANFVGIDTRMGNVVFHSYIVALGATPAEAFDNVIAVLFPSITVDP